MSGQRVVMVYSHDKKLVPYVVSEPVEVQVELSEPPTTQEQLLSTIARVFERGAIEARSETYWKSAYDVTRGIPHLDKQSQQMPIGTLPSDRAVYVMAAGLITPPEVIRGKNTWDTFSAQTLKNRAKGVETVAIVINEQGFPELLSITKSIDPTLDVYAVDDLARLRFRSAHRRGQPVAVLTTVNIDAQGEFPVQFRFEADQASPNK